MTEEKEEKSITIGFRATPTEAAAIDAAAAKNGLSRADHARSKVLSTTNDDASNGHLDTRLEKLEALIKHCIYMVNQVYVGFFSIAEAEGKAGHFLTAQQLDEVYDQTRTDALVYAIEFPESFAAVQAEIAALSKKAAA
jgi:hypothetical protein